MIWAAKGVKGVLTNGGARDTDEQLYQKAIPVWHRWVVQPMYQVESSSAGRTRRSRSAEHTSGRAT